MLCSFKKLIYPRTRSDAENGGYMVALYTLKEKVLDAHGDEIYDAKAVGYYLPLVTGIQFDLKGQWSKTAKHGLQFEVESYEEIVTPTKEGIVAYLSSGLIKGIGPKTAGRIYDVFGDKTLEVLDNHPEQFLRVKGISTGKLRRISSSYLASRAARDIVTLLAPHGVTANRAVKIFKHFGPETLSIIRSHPYRLCEMPGIGFKTADDIAKSLGLDPLAGERIDAGLMQTLKDAEAKGNLCMQIGEFVRQCHKLLNTENLSTEMVADRAFILDKAKKLIRYENYVYRDVIAKTEQIVADKVREVLAFGDVRYKCDLDAEIDGIQRKMGIVAAPEQRQAIKTGLTSHMCVITGGPGTGKSLILRFLLEIYAQEHSDAKIVCCAPTGRAARRMEECTGYPASTVHKALNMMPDEDGELYVSKKLDADLLLLDEASMLDIFISKHLLSALPYGCQVIIIGDADQLPSVGPGAVLSELIACGTIPVVKLDKVYRQDSGSRIAINARLIRHGTLNLECGDDFQFYESPGFAQSAKMIEQIYLSEVAMLGVDNVALLSPFRNKTETGVFALNELLRDMVNPPARSKPEITYGRRTFRLGDKVMNMKNNYYVGYTRPNGESGVGAFNGDIGIIRKIVKSSDESVVFVEFDDDKLTEFEYGDLESLELAYAQTIHKSQGSEFSSVIINIQMGHSIMLKRPLIYTAITRAKHKVSIVGERKALITAIRHVDAEKRGTKLAARINEQLNNAA